MILVIKHFREILKLSRLLDFHEFRCGKCEYLGVILSQKILYCTNLIFQSYYPLKTYGNASSVSHWINLGFVIIAWANAMMVAILPRFAWMNPETSGQIALSL